MKLAHALGIAVIGLTGCMMPQGEEGSEESVSSAREAVSTTNGTTLNGTTLNGTTLNGTTLNGTTLNGTTLNGTTLNGTTLNGTTLNGTTLNGTTLNGTSLIGSEWSATGNDGSTVRLRIDSIDPLSTNPAEDVFLYGVSYFEPTGQTCYYRYVGLTKVKVCYPTGSWHSICPAGEKAIPVKGAWGTSADPGGKASGTDDLMTWACTGGAIAKCITDLHYKPWLPDVNNISMSNLHEACVRMKRADYCGDGNSFTLDGTLVDVWDSASVQDQKYCTEQAKNNGMSCKQIPDWEFEAAWGPEGAKYVKDERWNMSVSCLRGDEEFTGTVGDYIATYCPRVQRAKPDTTFPLPGRTGPILFNGTGTRDYCRVVIDEPDQK